MRKSIPLKTLVLRKLVVAAAFSVLLTCLSTPCFANHRKKTLAPPPAPVEAPAPESSFPFGIIVLLLAGGGLGIWIFFLKKEVTSMSEKIKNLSDALTTERDVNESMTNKMERAQSEARGVSMHLDRTKIELNQSMGQIAKLKTRIENILLIDPKIEAKAIVLAKERAKVEAEKKEKEEALALQMEAKTQGKAQLDQLLSNMRRGY